MTDHIEVLRGLVAKWRDEADLQEFQALEAESVGLEDAAVGSRVRAGITLKRADELDAALAAMAAQPEAQAVPVAEWQYRRFRAPNGRLLPEAERAHWQRDPGNWHAKPEEHPTFEFRALYAAPPPSAVPEGSYAGCTLWRGSLRVSVTEPESIERRFDPDQSFCDMAQRALDSLAAAWDAGNAAPPESKEGV